MLCPRCSAYNRPEARFCRACGQPLPGAAPVEAPVPAEVTAGAAQPATTLTGAPAPAEGETAPTVPPTPLPAFPAVEAEAAPDEGAWATEASIAAMEPAAVAAEEPGNAAVAPAPNGAVEAADLAGLTAPPSEAPDGADVALAEPAAALSPEVSAGPVEEAEAVPVAPEAALSTPEVPGAAEPAGDAVAAEPGDMNVEPSDESAPAESAPAEVSAPPAEDEPAPEASTPVTVLEGVPLTDVGAQPENEAAAETRAPAAEGAWPDAATAAAPEPPPEARAVPVMEAVSTPEVDALEPTAATEQATTPLTAEAAAPPVDEAGAPDQQVPLATGGSVPLELTAESAPQPDAEASAETDAAAAATAAGDAATPFGVPPAAPQPPPEVEQAAALADATHPPPAEAPMAPAAPGDQAPDERATTQLAESETPNVAPPVPGEAFPALAPGDLVAGRYQIQQVLQTGPQRQTYLALDTQGYRRCWACGSRDNVPGELYCTDCGAQLSGRMYRLLETPPETPFMEVPPPLLENQVPGVAMVLDAPTDPATGRHYLVLEDVGGQPLNAWQPANPPAVTSGEEERVLGLVNQAAEELQTLHAAGIIGCDFTPHAFQLLPDDRLVLADPSACRLAGQVGDGRDPHAEAQADVQRVAAALEQWYREVHGGEAAATDGDASTISGVLAHGREGGYHTANEFAAAIKELLSFTVAPRDLQLVSGRASDVGEQRQLNEDSLFALEYVAMEAAGASPLGIYVVADGMGGHDSGEVASSIAIRTIATKLNSIVEGRISGEQQELNQEARGEVLRMAILEANERITRLSHERGSDMGTTVTMALVLGNQATVANIGDSRTYLWRDGKLHQITQDHSLVARLIAAGQITPEEGRHYERRNEIYRALGDPHLKPDEIDVFHVALRPLDALLLCSDGLWEMVRDEEIEQIMLDAPDPPAASQTLIDVANHNGGEDNISVIIAQTLTSAEY